MSAVSQPGCKSAPNRYPALLWHRRLKLFKKAISGGVPIGADWDPARVEIPEEAKVISSGLVGSRFGAYSHFQAVIAVSGCSFSQR